MLLLWNLPFFPDIGTIKFPSKHFLNYNSLIHIFFHSIQHIIIYFVISSFNHGLFRNVLFNFQIIENIPLFPVVNF